VSVDRPPRDHGGTMKSIIALGVGVVVALAPALPSRAPAEPPRPTASADGLRGNCSYSSAAASDTYPARNHGIAQRQRRAGLQIWPSGQEALGTRLRHRSPAASGPRVTMTASRTRQLRSLSRVTEGPSRTRAAGLRRSQ
jgi:hypothetical protein